MSLLKERAQKFAEGTTTALLDYFGQGKNSTPEMRAEVRGIVAKDLETFARENKAQRKAKK